MALTSITLFSACKGLPAVIDPIDIDGIPIVDMVNGVTGRINFNSLAINVYRPSIPLTGTDISFECKSSRKTIAYLNPLADTNFYPVANIVLGEIPDGCQIEMFNVSQSYNIFFNGVSEFAITPGVHQLFTYDLENHVWR